MRNLAGKLREYYDFVIIDSPPVLAVTDACILGNLADATIFVSKAGSTNRDEAGRALEFLRANNIEPIGALFNDQNRKRKGYGYGKYGYGYGGYSNYGYGHSTYGYTKT